MRLAALCLGVLCAVLVTIPARAETEADRATARALALEGHAALQKKDYATAADRFNRADQLVHAPTLVVDLARALQGLGRFVEAHEKYELVLREGVDSRSPKSWTRALEEAKKELDALKPRLAWVTVVLKEPSEATVKIDGLLVPPAAVGVKRAADPGFPEVTVTAEGYEPFKETVTVGSGEEKTVEVTLKKLPEVQGPEPRPSDAVYRPRQHDPTRRALTYVAFGLGGAGAVTGGVFGAMFLKKRADLRSECVDGYCRSTSTKKISTYHTYGTISMAAAGVGVLGLGTGLVLLLTEPKAEKPTPTTGLGVRPVLGLGLVGAEGTFQ